VVGDGFEEGDLVGKSVMKGVCEVVWNLGVELWGGDLERKKKKARAGDEAARDAEIGSVVERAEVRGKARGCSEASEQGEMLGMKAGMRASGFWVLEERVSGGRRRWEAAVRSISGSRRRLRRILRLLTGAVRRSLTDTVRRAASQKVRTDPLKAPRSRRARR
jgi:hypothetical protein